MSFGGPRKPSRNRPHIRACLLTLSVILTLGFVVLCIISAVYSIMQLNQNINTLMNRVKMKKVKQYEPPAVLFLANGISTYSCIASSFRLEPEPQDSDFPELDPNDNRGRIQDVCNESSTIFQIPLSELSNYQEVLDLLPDWLSKNIATTVTGAGSCIQEDEEKRRQREKRDSFDDLDFCEGKCQGIWECSNEPSSCDNGHLFEQCFIPMNPLREQEPCLTTIECLGGPVVLQQSCGHFLACLDEENALESECSGVMECFLTGIQSDYCTDLYQCLEDQVETKCLEPTTYTTSLPDGQESEQDCEVFNSMIEGDASVAGQKNEPLSLIIIKGPSDFAEKNYVFASLRLQEGESGSWIAEHPSFSKLTESLETSDKFDFLLEVIQTLHWKFYARGFRVKTLMTESVMKVEGVIRGVDIRTETYISRVNISESLKADFRPVEVVYSWKDGYLRESDRFYSATIWDIFAIVAGIILMLERAWITWGKVVQKYLDGKSKISMMKFQENSLEWKMLAKVRQSGGNLFTSMVALNRLNKLFNRLNRMKQKREQIEKRTNEKIEKKVHRIKRKMAIKSGVVDDSVLSLDEKRFYEWESYRAILRQMMQEQQATQSVLDKMEAERLARILRDQLQTSQTSLSSSESAARSKSLKSKSPDSDISAENEEQVGEAKSVSHLEQMREMKQKKQKVFTASNPNFSLEEVDDFYREISASELETGKHIWQTKYMDYRGKRAPSKSGKDSKPPKLWKTDAFQD